MGSSLLRLDGRNVVLIHGFKDYCALLFMKGALLKDPKGILIQQTKNVHLQGKSGLLLLRISTSRKRRLRPI